MSLQFYLSLLFNDKDYLLLSDEECIAKSRPISNALIKRWHDSNFTDFSIYQGRDYFHDLIICYYYISKQNVEDMFKFFKTNGISTMNKRFFDDYNGFGFTTTDVRNRGVYYLSYFNDVEVQSEVTQKLFKKCGYSKPRRCIDKVAEKNQYDVVMCFDNVEHSQEPLIYLKEVIDLIKEGGYLAYSDGFTKLYAGHFPTYYVGNRIYNIDEMKPVVLEFLASEGFEIVDKKEGQRLILFKKVKAHG